MLYVVATPIGNLEDITLRAVRILKEVDFILAEDSRKAVNLLRGLSIDKPVEAFFEHNEKIKIPGVIERLARGQSAALISEAGAPTISDPGYCLVRECRAQGLPVTALPGPSSVINALMLSAAPREKFAFLGFLPRKHNERKKLAKKLQEWELTAVVFESPHRLVSALKDLREVLGERRITVAREMTKKFEETRETTLGEAIEYFTKQAPRGEFTVVIYRTKEKKAKGER